jgi:hypothetical protein
MSLWFFDGHPDFLDGAASETGETADMELAVLTGSGAAPLVQLAGPAPMTLMVPVERVMLLGHRAEDLDDASAAELAVCPPCYAGSMPRPWWPTLPPPASALPDGWSTWTLSGRAPGYTSTWTSSTPTSSRQ